ncbi:MAG TPA: hypothetical protein VFA07_18125 [Chthonomonadaceae bacterium]|nr:hypothetical protein [Chthonomonadaceae bacterium]
MRVERVDLLEFAEKASCFLLAAWPRPCLHYTPAYLRWQFGFPGSIPPVGVAVFDEDELVGFNGSTLRRLRFQQTTAEILLASFASVHPARRGGRAPGTLYRGMLEALRDCGLPHLAYAEGGSPGDLGALRAAPSAGFCLQRLGPFPVYGYVPHPDETPATVQVVETDDPLALLPAIRACDDTQTLWNAPDETMLAHYHKDPRPHALTLLYGPEGDLRGAAIVVQAEFVTAQGFRSVIMLDNLFLPRPDAETLHALCAFAAGRWAEQIGSVRITLPNVWGIDPGILEAAGLRHRQGHFIAQVCATDPAHPFLQAAGTNLEIV